MPRAVKNVLIVDNATTCAMRIKILVNIHGAKANVVHWTDWQEVAVKYAEQPPCLVIIEETVPNFVAEMVVEQLSLLPFFLLFNSNKKQKTWTLNKQVNPLSSSLSNFELMTLLEPYWAEEKAINLPSVLILDDAVDSSYKITQELSDANIPCRIVDRVSLATIKDVDMVLVNVACSDKRVKQLIKIKEAYPLIGILAYGEVEQLSQYEFIKFALKYNISDLFLSSELDNSKWLAKFYAAWSKRAELKDQQLVSERVQTSLDTLLEKSLVMEVLFANSLDGLVAFKEDGSILKCNDGFSELLGYVKEQVSSANIYRLLSLQTRSQLQDLLESEHLIQQQVLDLQLKHQHNVLIPVSCAINRINFHGLFVYVAVMRNNTNQQLQQKILVQKNVQLEHRVREISRQREICTEMSRKSTRKKNAFMISFTDFLSKSDSNKVHINKINNVNLYLKVESGQESCHPKPIHLKPLVESALAHFHSVIKEADLSFKVSINEKQQVVFCQKHLEKILIELVNNSIQYTLHGGKIDIKLSGLSDQQVELSFADTGIGILEHRQLQLFDLYEVNSHDLGGISTGLPLVKALMQLNRGEVYVDNHSLKGEVIGTVVTLKIPIN